MKIVQSLPEPVWRSYVQRHPEGNIFHSPEMYQVFCRARAHDPEIWAAVDDTGAPLALLLPVFVSTMQGPWKRLTGRSVAYGSVLCNSGPEGAEALRLLLDNYNNASAKRVLYTELRNLSDKGSIQSVLQDSGYVYKKHLNYLVDLDRSEEELIGSFGKSLRKNIRSSLRKGQVVMEECDSKEKVKICYELLKKTYGRARIFLADYSLFEAAFDILQPKQMIRYFLGQVDGDYIVSSVELLYKDTMYGWYGGVDRAFSKYNPNELLTWHLFIFGIANGYKIYDFGGAGSPDEEYGVRDFKAKFNGQLVCYGRNTCVHAPSLLKFSKMGYGMYQALLSLRTNKSNRIF